MKENFVDDEARQQHWESAPVHRNTYCPECRKNFNEAQDLKDHYRTSSFHKSSYCQHCNKVFVDSDALTDHKVSKHPKCSLCKIEVASREAFRKHLSTSSKHKDVYCQRCDRSFDDKTSLLQHKIDNSDKHFFCRTCSLDHADRHKLVEHLTTHRAHRLLYDAQCDILFDSEASKWSHKASTPQKHHVCEPCRLDFRDRALFLGHWTTTKKHKNTYDITCDILFATAELKAAHIKSTASKHYLCKRCNLDFPTSEGRAAHNMASPAHQDTFCRSCALDFKNAKKLRNVSF